MDPFSNLVDQLLDPSGTQHEITSYAVLIMSGIFVLAIFLRLVRRAPLFTGQAATLLTSVGILGTFLGIVIGLQGVDLSNTATEASVRTLLGGMTLAFTSSLVGMAFSIAYKIMLTIPPLAQKSQNSENQNREVLFLLHKTAAASDEQTKALASIAKAIGATEHSGTAELLVSMKDMLDERMKTLVNTAVSQQRQTAQLNDSMDRLVQSLVEDDAQSLTGQMRGLRNELGDRHRQQNAAMMEIIDASIVQKAEQQAQTEALTKVYESQTTLVDIQQSTAEKLVNAMSELATLGRQHSETNKIQLTLQELIAETVKRDLPAINETLAQIFAKQTTQLSVQQESAETSRQGNENLSNRLDALGQTIESPLVALVSHQETQNNQLESQIDHLRKLIENSLDHKQQLNDAWNAADGHLNAIKVLLERSPTEGLIDALKTTIREFNEHISEQFGDNFAQLNTAVGNLLEWQENYRIQMKDMREQFDNSVAAMNLVSVGVGTVGENIEQIHRHTEQIPEHMQHLGQVVQTNQSQVSILESHLSAFAETRDRAVEALPKISEAVDISVKGMVSASDSLTSAANDSATALKTATGELHETISSGAQDLKVAFTHSLDGYVKATQTVNETAQGVSERTQAEAIRLFDHLQETIKSAHEDSARSNHDLIREQFEHMVKVRQEEVEAVMSEMAAALTQVTGRFTNDYSKLVNAMGEIVQQAANDANR